MNIEVLVRKAVTEIKLKWGIPEKGFIAGGSIANLVWNYHSGEKSKVNDIDVFLKSEKQEPHVFEYRSKKINYTDCYGHFKQQLRLEDQYTIYSVSREGMLNLINISENATPTSILESFDINATCVGYSIEEDKVYYLESFIQFLETGSLKITNMMTPAHTAIRLIKKKHDLNAKVDEFEMRIVQFCLDNKKTFRDFGRFRFQQKYADMFVQYKTELEKYFKIKSCLEIDEWISKSQNKKVNIYELETEKSKELMFFNLGCQSNFPPVFLMTTNDMLFYFRNIIGNEKLEKIWPMLMPIIKDKNYLDDSREEQIDFIKDFIKLYPSCITNLSKYKLNEQFKLVNKVIATIGKEFDIETAARVIENNNLNPNDEIDEFDTTILGLSARRDKKYKRNYVEEELLLPF